MDAVNCKINIPKIEGLEDQVLTVGRRFILACDGDWDKQFNFTQAHLDGSGLKPEMIHVFQAQAVDLKGFEVDATFYVASKISGQSLTLKDGVLEVPLSMADVQIQSVLPTPQSAQSGQSQQPPQPHGFLLSDLALPQIYFFSAAILIVLFCVIFVYSILRRRFWRKLEADLRNYDSPLSPEGQAYRNLRLLDKTGFNVIEFKKLIYLYILRRYQTPIFELKKNKSQRRLNSYLKAKWPRLKNQRRQIFHFINDLEALEKLSLEEQVDSSKRVVRRFYDFVDDSERYFTKSKLEKENL
jgi:hypothetical protein